MEGYDKAYEDDWTDKKVKMKFVAAKQKPRESMRRVNFYNPQFRYIT